MSISEINELNIQSKASLQKPRMHKVSKGDTLFSIAKAYGVSVDDLRKINKLKDDKLSLGASLSIPTVKESKTVFDGSKKTLGKGIDMFKEVSDDEIKFQQERSKFVKVTKNSDYKVKAGDTPATIAERFDINTKRLLDANGLKEGNIIGIDKTLKIPNAYKAQNVKNPKDLSKATGLSENYLNELIKMEEFHQTAYTDKNGNLTIGVGHAIKPEELKKYKNAKLSKEQVYTLLAQDLIDREQNVKSIVGYGAYKKMPQPVKDSVMDFVFNRGESMFEDNAPLVSALKTGKYPEAISKLNTDYSIVKDKNGKEVKKNMSGLSKRRLFEMSHASKIFNGNVPSVVLNSAQNVYQRGLYFMGLEKNNGSLPKDAYGNVKAEYNELTNKWFNGKIKLK